MSNYSAHTKVHIEVKRLVRDCVPTLSLPGVNSKRRASLSRVDQHAAFAASTPMFTSPIIDTIIEGTDGLLCLRKTGNAVPQAMWGKRTGFEAVTTQSRALTTELQLLQRPTCAKLTCRGRFSSFSPNPFIRFECFSNNEKKWGNN